MIRTSRYAPFTWHTTVVLTCTILRCTDLRIYIQHHIQCRYAEEASNISMVMS